ncbi:MAG: tRNA pseudouridine(55) synthase TruB [Acidimicrobiia bacterium]
MDGLVVVDKPAGWTSHDVVAKLRRVFGIKRIGHAGTLDPGATGVLLVGVGRATRLLRFLLDTTKVYEGGINFGVATDTLDAAGQETARSPMPALTAAALVEATRRFVGEIDQVPPMVSAVKVDGRRLHELARRGEEIERAPRRVRIDSIDVESFEAGDFPRATVRVSCGSGTYIRSLADDLGRELGGCAHLGSLRRLAVGSFGLDEAHPLAEVEEQGEALVLPPAEAVRHLEQVTVAADLAQGVRHGAVFPVALLCPGGAQEPVAIIGPEADLLAVYERRAASARPLVVMSGA